MVSKNLGVFRDHLYTGLDYTSYSLNHVLKLGVEIEIQREMFLNLNTWEQFYERCGQTLSKAPPEVMSIQLNLD
jgi:outer membrane protein W